MSNLYACKNSLVQVKDQYNLSLFYVKLGKKISTNVNHAGGKLPFDQFFVNSRSKGKNEPNFDDGANCFGNISNEWNNYMTPPGRTVEKITYGRIFS